MKILKGLPTVTILTDTYSFEIKSMQYIDEQQDKVILRCAEHVPEFIRGFTCDIALAYSVEKFNMDDILENHHELISDTVLVHINRCAELDGIVFSEYVFYK